VLGTDFEAFFSDGNKVTPALVAFHAQKNLRMRKVKKNIRTDISPGGYSSLRQAFDKSFLIEDGLAFEVPTKPEEDPNTLVENMREGILHAKEIAKELGLYCCVEPVVFFDPKYLETQPELRVLGCSPDRSIYGMNSGVPRQDPTRINWRTSGGHIHLSIAGVLQDASLVENTILWCDSILGLADVIMEHSEKGLHRREMYGQAGKFRIQKWGVEYRTPSSVWAINAHTAKVFLSLAHMVHQLVEKRIQPPERIPEVIDTITNCDAISAAELLHESLELSAKNGINPPECASEIFSLFGIGEKTNYKMEWEI